MTQQAESVEQALLHHAERQTAALETLRRIAVVGVWVVASLVFLVLVVLYVGLVS